MKEKPILFRTEMVRALLDGRKTQTRRVIKPQPKTDGLQGVYPDLYNHEPNRWAFWLPDNRMTEPRIWECPYGQVSDHLWVRETFKYTDFDLRDAGKLPHRCEVEYKLNGIRKWVLATTDTQIVIPDKWRPSIFMPRWASRITLEITGIKVQRIYEISPQDIEAEGIKQLHFTTGVCLVSLPQFKLIWDSINGKKYPWSSNPWVWVIEFKKLDATA
jgi:hypothetical protein